jgi:transcriptional regulator with XRE-family HTH domain
MDDFSKYLSRKLADPEFRKEYMRIHAYSDLANQLILLRNKRGYSQQTVADLVHTTQTVISRIENVSGNPSLATIQKYAEALNSYIKIEVIPDEDFHYSDFYLEDYFQNIKSCTNPPDPIVYEEISSREINFDDYESNLDYSCPQLTSV